MGLMEDPTSVAAQAPDEARMATPETGTTTGTGAITAAYKVQDAAAEGSHGMPDGVAGGALHDTPADERLGALVALMRSGNTLVLSGAGISTESGIPDYRGPDRSGPVRQPMTYQNFVRSETARRRYWARSAVGWPAMRSREPNAGHRAVARLETAGLVSGVLTQNVDGLHQAAGSQRTVELHGSLSQVVCLACRRREPRAALQLRLEALNPGFSDRVAAILPDGDAVLPEAWADAFVPAACRWCGGTLKADVVFFGENVPRERVEQSYALLEEADALLVLGSSLTVRSGYRFVAAAVAAGKPVGIVNQGPTRGDDDASVRLEGRLGEVLPALVTRLTG